MVAASYYRFFLLHDHLVSYETSCNPEIESCYMLCEDESIEDLTLCPDEQIFYYAMIERYGATLTLLCGETINNCDAANTCTDREDDCAISYCDPNTEAEYCDQLPSVSDTTITEYP